jgi:hypothetical protein
MHHEYDRATHERATHERATQLYERAREYSASRRRVFAFWKSSVRVQAEVVMGEELNAELLFAVRAFGNLQSGPIPQTCARASFPTVSSIVTWGGDSSVLWMRQ